MFPCFNPILLFDLSDRERRRPNVQAAPFDLLQARSQRVQLEAVRAIFLRRIHRHDNFIAFFLTVNGRRQPEHPLHQFDHGFLRLRSAGN